MSGVENSDNYPGSSLGLPEKGTGSLASWGTRIAAILIDWAASMVLAMGMFGLRVWTERGWPSFMFLAVFFVESTILTMTLGGSFGQLIARIGIIRLDRQPILWWQAFIRSTLKCLVIPALVIGAERRSITDIVLGTVVVNRR